MTTWKSASVFRCTSIAGLIAASIFYAQASNAAVLASIDASTGYGQIQVFSSFEYRVSVGDGVLSGNVFSEFVSVGDIGGSIIVDSGLEFDAATALLTNGIDDPFGFFYLSEQGAGPGDILTESEFFFDGLAIDFAGYNIDFFELVVDNVTFTSPGQDPNGDGLWTDVTFDGTFLVHGTPVPLPGALLFMVSGMAALRLVYRPNRV